MIKAPALRIAMGAAAMFWTERVRISKLSGWHGAVSVVRGSQTSASQWSLVRMVRCQIRPATFALAGGVPDRRCSWQRSGGTRRGTRFARVHGAIVLDPPQLNGIRSTAQATNAAIRHGEVVWELAARAGDNQPVNPAVPVTRGAILSVMPQLNAIR